MGREGVVGTMGRGWRGWVWQEKAGKSRRWGREEGGGGVECDGEDKESGE